MDASLYPRGTCSFHRLVLFFFFYLFFFFFFSSFFSFLLFLFLLLLPLLLLLNTVTVTAKQPIIVLGRPCPFSATGTNFRFHARASRRHNIFLSSIGRNHVSRRREGFVGAHGAIWFWQTQEMNLGILWVIVWRSWRRCGVVDDHWQLQHIV